MLNKKLLKKQILYRSTHRGSKEMDLILGNFVKKHIDTFDINDLRDLANLLIIEDEILYKFCYRKSSQKNIKKTRVAMLLKNFKL
tara:strand:+ start:162 stop:416 length:255 start_codon:yes stop_codon:yes gene_type:complete